MFGYYHGNSGKMRSLITAIGAVVALKNRKYRFKSFINSPNISLNYRNALIKGHDEIGSYISKLDKFIDDFKKSDSELYAFVSLELRSKTFHSHLFGEDKMIITQIINRSHNIITSTVSTTNNSVNTTVTADLNSIDPITQVAVSNTIINATPSNYYKSGYAFNNVSYYGSKTTFTMNSSNYITIVSDGDPFPAVAGSPTFTNDYSDNIARVWSEVPNPLTEQNYNYTFPYRGATNTSNPQSFFDDTGMGIQGIFANGAALYNPSSGSGTVPGTTISGNNKYYLNAVFFEPQYGIDAAGGHPSPNGNKVNGKQGQYHYHDSMFLSSGAWNNTTFFGSNIYFSGTNYSGDYIRNTDGHSKILGICFDGYPIYGPYGYTSALDSTSTVILMKSSYVTNVTEFSGRPYRYTNYVSGYTISAGAFLDDYYYDSTVGTLDEYNGRYCVTPEYPNGTYAYFTTVDEASVPQFPYIIGPYSKQQRTVVNNGYSN